MTTGAYRREDAVHGTILVLSAGDVEVQVSLTHGSTIFSLKVKGVEIISTPPEHQLRTVSHGIFSTYPIPNRLRDRSLTVNGTTYSFPDAHSSDSNILVNGFAQSVYWKVNMLPKKNADKAVGETYFVWSSLDQPEEVFNIFPFKATLVQTYTVTSDSVRVEYMIQNNSVDTPLPFGYSLHPSFKRLSESTKICLPAKTLIELDAELLPTGERVPVSDRTEVDLITPQELSGLDVEAVYTDLAGAPYIEYPDQDLRVTIESSDDFRYATINTKDPESISIDMQTCNVDAFNAKDPASEGLIELEPRQQHSGYTLYTFS